MGAALPCGLRTAPGRIEVGLYASFQHVPSVAVREAAQEELAAVVMPIGILVQWRSVADSSSDPSWNRIAIIHFSGHCDASEVHRRPPHPWKFGSTWVSDGKVIPSAEIRCDVLRAYLAPTLVSEQRQRAAVFGRALGRVLAHELYHILAETKRHGTGGVGKKSFTPAQLTADEFQFEEVEAQRVRLAISSLTNPAQNHPCEKGPVGPTVR